MQRLDIHRLRLGGIDAVVGDLVRRDPAADAQLQPAAAHLVEHADLLGDAQGMVQRQRVDQRPEAQPARALRHRREEHAGRGRHAERRGVVLGQVIAAQAQPVVGLDQLQPVLVVLAQRHRAEVEMIEDAELHVPVLHRASHSVQGIMTLLAVNTWIADLSTFAHSPQDRQGG